ncbi:diguanylate cyclase [Sporosarcina sp. ANT_H38]|uniref:sensor domain-containing diguanylate cyclase n=1 Tax=Sporosarcina sp. ANT_H38 TaxID=2597358 RepID=UPI0011F2C529|nr:diguanylate cyclase [Sporosarcina sp. ANT_H38]KAA0965470.1 diguanylate cyclase [Sporosarcina sp. ANT_H38]
MDDQLNFAPCGYLTMDRNGYIFEMNATLQKMLGQQELEWNGQHIHSLLTTPSRIYYQTYFLPLLDINGDVNEIYLTLKSTTGKIPVLMNAIERKIEHETRIECVIVEMKIRDEYENELIQERRNAESVVQKTDKAYEGLQQLLKEVECKKNELETINEKLKVLALTDSLTGLKNRRYFEEQLLLFIESYTTSHIPFSLLAIDIDHFKRINDTFGHPIGDLVLQEVSLILQESKRPHDIVARIGGEEFIILLPETNLEKAFDIAELTRKRFELFEWSYTPLTISSGVTMVRQGDTTTTIIRRTDATLYASKNAGRNIVSIG